MSRSLTATEANAIYDVLVEHADAWEGDRVSFVHHQTTDKHITEWRFIGALGFGGKFWRNPGFGPDGTYGEQWYVNCYSEHLTDARRAVIDRTNAALAELRESEAAPSG